MSAFRRFDPWTAIADETGGAAKAAKPAKAAAPVPAVLNLNAAGRPRSATNFSHFSRFSRGEPRDERAESAEAAAVVGEPATDARGNGAWGEADWRAYVEERRGAAERCGGADGATAARWAYEACVTRWLDTNPPPDDPTRCAYSGEALPPDGGDAVPVLRGGGGHLWVRRRHLERWRARRRAAAVAALAALGVRAP